MKGIESFWHRANQHRSVRFLTLTITSSPEEPLAPLIDLVESASAKFFAKRGPAQRAGNVLGAITGLHVSWRVHFDGRRNRWHVHVHGVVQVPVGMEPDFEALNDGWSDALGERAGSVHVDYSPGGVQQRTQYLVKNRAKVLATLDHDDLAEYLAAMLNGTENTRVLRHTYGIARVGARKRAGATHRKELVAVDRRERMLDRRPSKRRPRLRG